MGAGARYLLHERLGCEIPSAARESRPRRATAERWTARRPVWEGNIHLLRVRLLPAVAGGRAGRHSVVRKPTERRAERRTRRSRRQVEGHEPSHEKPLCETSRSICHTSLGALRCTLVPFVLTPGSKQDLIRGIGLREGISLNVIEMIGIGPFITIPLIIHAAGGPQAMLGWIFGAVLAMCDGLVWAELGAALPRAGGSYEYLKEIYGPRGPGRWLSFLYVWQLMMSAPLSAASGCVGVAQYAGFIFPSLQRVIAVHSVNLRFGGSRFASVGITITCGTFVAVLACVLAIALAYRRVDVVGRISNWLLVGVFGAIAWIIWAGIAHFDSARAFDFPPGAFHLNHAFFLGMGSAMLIATYDYWGYYNICYLGAEVRDPGRTIPRAILYAILIVAAIYIVMNISILGVVPWRELDQAAATDSRFYVVSTMMQRLYGTHAGQ